MPAPKITWYPILKDSQYMRFTKICGHTRRGTEMVGSIPFGYSGIRAESSEEPTASGEKDRSED